MLKNILVSFIIACTSASVCAQNQNDQITIAYSDKPLGEILKEITGKYGVNFLYSNELSILKQRVSINAKDVSLEAFLTELFDKAGADFKMIDGHVAINERPNSQPINNHERQSNQRPEKKGQLSLKPQPIKDQVNEEKPSPRTELINQSESDQQPVEVMGSTENSINKGKSKDEANGTLDSDKKNNVDNEPLARNTLNGNSFIGVILRGDSYSFTRPTFEGSKGSFTQHTNYSLGISLNHVLSDKWTVEIQTLLSRRNFQLNYNFQVVDLEDPLVVDYTSFDLLYISVPINVSREVLNKDKLSLSIIAGLSPEFLVRQDVRTYLKSGTENSAPNSLGSVRPFTFAVQAGLRAEFQINEKFNLAVSPSFQKYLTKFNDGETGINIHALSLNIGLHYKL